MNIERIIVGDGELGLPPDIWNLPPLPVAAGPYPADWKGMEPAYAVPEWWRDAKFGAWAHWDPQSMPEQGDWYARGMYQEGNAQYSYHIQHFGHPSEYGYKDICHNWVIDRWKPEELMDLYVEMGAKYFMAMGVHHDNFDCWDSTYQPWNSVERRPQGGHRRHVGKGRAAKRDAFWHRFSRLRRPGPGASSCRCVTPATSEGPKQGVPYDALQTILDGKGKWWEGMDPVDLYGPVHNTQRSAAFAVCQPVHVAGG